MTVTRLVTTPDSGSTPNASGAFTPTAGTRLVAVIVGSASTPDSNDVPTASANGITFVRAATVVQATNHNDIYVANQLVPASPASMTVSWAPTDVATSTVIDVYEVTGMTRTGLDAVKQTDTGTGTAGTTPETVFAAACQTGNVTIVSAENVSAPAGVTEPSGWTEANDTNCTTPTVGLEVAYRLSGFTGTTITWGSTSATAWSAVAVELDTSVLYLDLVQELDGQSQTGNQTFTATLAAIDDLIVLIQADDFYTLANLLTPTGTAVTTWTEQTANGLPVDGGTNDNHAKVWTGVVTTAGGTVIANRTNVDDEGYAAVFVFRGAAGTPEFDTGDATESDSTATSHVAPSVTPTSGKTDDFLLCVFGTLDAVVNYTMPGGMTAYTEQDVGGINTYRAASEQLTTDSATGTRTATASATNTWFAVSVLVKTASAGGATVTPATVAAVASIPAATLQTGSIVTATSVTAVAAVPAPTVQLSVAITPVTVVAVAAVPAPTVQTGSTVAATSVAAVASVPAPTAQAGSTVIATTVAATAAVPAPTVTTGGGSATVPATTVTAVAGIPAPTVQAGSTVIATTVNAVASVPAPTVTTGSTVVATAVAAVAAVPAPTITTGGSVNIPATTVAALAAIPAPALSTGQRVTAITVTALAAVPAVTIRLGAAISPITVIGTATIPAPTLSVGVIIPTFTVAAIATIPTPAIVFIGPPDPNPLRFAFTEPAPMTYTEPGAFVYHEHVSSFVYQEG